MQWNEVFIKTNQPSLEQISDFIANPLWDQLQEYLASAYGTKAKIEHSICSGAPGWNVKYKKSSRALCTLYPHDGYFTCMISVGSKEVPEAEFMMGSFSDYLQTLYGSAKPFNGARWLMIDVTSSEILEDVKRLLALRAKPKTDA